MPIEFNKVTWYSKLLAIIVFIAVFVVAFYIGRKYEKTMNIVENNSTYIAKSEKVLQETSGNPLNSKYFVDGEEVTLTKGVAKISGTETRVFGEFVKGDINQDGQLDQVSFLSQETSGTGIFFYVIAYVNGKGTEAFFIGDRISPQNINIVNGKIAVNYATRKSNEPMTATPSLGVTKYLVYRDDKLVEDKIVRDIFESSPRSDNTSNVVGYFASGAFVWNSVPDWVVQHWTSGDKKGNDNIIIFSPRDEIVGRDFSDIVIETYSTTEQFNADSMYESYKKIESVDVGKLMIAEIFLNSTGDTQIYHVQRLINSQIDDTFYIDGNTKTAVITFQAKPDNYAKYGAKIKEFVQGIGKGGQPRG